MSNSDADQAFERFKQLVEPIDLTLTEADSRAKIIDPIFKEVLGWNEEDITREEHVHEGFIDYIFKIGGRTIFVLEAKKVGSSFTIPLGLKKRRYKLSGSISTDRKIEDAINQAHKYSIESGTRFAIVSNGRQFILFESFKYSGKWRDGFCTIFHSIQDIKDNFTLFRNILSKNAVISGSLRKHIAEETLPLDFKRPLDFVHNQEASSGKNFLSMHLNPIIDYIFSDLTADSKLEILRKCYVRQRQLTNTDSIMKSSFDRLPHYAKRFDINWFRESEIEAGEFQVSFEKCLEFSRTQTPLGSIIILLGGIGSGKTTFIHHFFKIGMENRDDVLWFYVDFGKSPPNLDEIEQFIYDSIVEHYEKSYKTKLVEYLESLGLRSIAPNNESLIVFFTMLRFKGYTISIVLDNVDQHSYTSPSYQERVFELAQNLTDRFKTVTILTLREESFFRSTRSGVLDAYHIPMFHVASPNFEELIRNRVDYALDFLNRDPEEIMKITKSPFSNIDTVKLFLISIKNSIRRSRKTGRDILRFINDISGGNMRQALRFVNTFMTSGNTDIEEIIFYEQPIPPDSPPERHYQIPLHHIVRAIILGDYRYYTSSHSHIMNLFQVNPQYTNSHFVHLRILDYLHKRINYYVALDIGFVDIDQVIENAEIAGISQKAIEDSLKKLSNYGLVEYDNQNKDGYETATYVRITTTGIYYLEQLVNDFSYLELIFGDTLNCDEKVSKELKKRLNVDYIADKKDRMLVRFERTGIFLEYLKRMEEDEFKNNPDLLSSDLTRTRFMNNVLKKYSEDEKYIREKLFLD
jgi:KaiC/GvpD/RAD55 family RecA-like ATPase/DNA-binding PadR family transcriptional regulator